MSLKLWRVYCIQEAVYYEVISVSEPTDCPINPGTDDIDTNATVIILDDANIDTEIEGNVSANIIGSVFGIFTGNLVGNTTVKGTLTVDDSTQSTDCVTGALVVKGGVGVGLNLNVCGNVSLGNTNAEHVTFNADINSDIVPNTHESFDLGEATKAWGNLYTNYTLTNTVESYDGNTISVVDRLSPFSDNTIDLGSQSLRWKKVYADTLCGNLTGNVSGDIVSNNTSIFNGTVNFSNATITGLDGAITVDDIWILLDKKSSGVRGGTFTSGAWRTRTINTAEVNPGSDVTLSSNQFTMTAGKYFIMIRAPAHGVGSHQIRLYNVTDSSVEQYGTSEVTDGSDSDSDDEGGQSESNLTFVLNVPSTKTYRVEHRSEHSQSRTGFGFPAGFSGNSEIYTRVEIIRLTD